MYSVVAHIPLRCVDTEVSLFSKEDFWGFSISILCSTNLHPSPFRFHCVGGCWDWIRTVAALALDISCSNLAARTHPHSDRCHPRKWTFNLFKVMDFVLWALLGKYNYYFFGWLRTGSALLKRTSPFINTMHCIENRIYVFSKKGLRGLSPNFYIHVPVSDLYIPRILSKYLAAATQTDWSWKYINLSQK